MAMKQARDGACDETEVFCSSETIEHRRMGCNLVSLSAARAAVAPIVPRRKTNTLKWFHT